MDTQTIDQEYQKLEGEFEDLAKTVQGLVQKMQAAEQAGDANAKEWLGDMKQIVQDIGDEQTQAKVVLLAIHGFIKDAATQSAGSDENPPLYAPGREPQAQPQPQPVYQQQPMGGMMMGGPMMGGYMGGGFARAMEMGAGIGLGQALLSGLFR